MSAAEFTQLIPMIKYGLLGLSPPIAWFLLRTRMAHTLAMVVRVATWDWLLRRKGVSMNARRKLIAEAAKRDLEAS